MFKCRENQAKLIDEKPFIFLESKSDVAKDAYVEWAITLLKKQEEQVHVFDVPYAYKFDFVDRYREKLLTTGYHGTQQGSQLYSIFQLDKKNHMIATYHFDVEDLKKDFLSVVLISNKPSAFLDLIKDNKDIEENFEPANRAGFNLR